MGQAQTELILSLGVLPTVAATACRKNVVNRIATATGERHSMIRGQWAFRSAIGAPSTAGGHECEPLGGREGQACYL